MELLVVSKQPVVEDVQASDCEQLGQVQFTKPDMGKIIEEEEEEGDDKHCEIAHLV